MILLSTGLEVAFAFFKGGLSGGEPGDRDAHWRARDVVQANAFAEADAVRVAAVLAAEAQLQRWVRGAALFDGDLDEATDAKLIDALERVVQQEAASPGRSAGTSPQRRRG